ncbi:MAG: type II toxin-antitoxin system ParD family antitoxin [Paracoccaceae bacterium]
MTVKSSISLSDEHHAFARAQVQGGRFPSVSAVVQHGLELIRQKAEDEQMERAALRMLLQDRLAGAFVTGDDLRGRVEAMVAARGKAAPAK